MTAQPPPQQFTERDEDKLTWGAARSDWLDAFADVETEVGKCLDRRCPGKNKTNLSQHLSNLAALEPSPTLSWLQHARLGILVAQCRQTLPLRHTMVHSHMRVDMIDTVPVALFSNVAGEAHKALGYVAMTKEQIAKSTRELRQLAADLRAFA
jgi:hypothetical protein